MKLTELLQGWVKCDDDNILIGGLTLNTRHLKPGDLFIAIKGLHFDGRAYLSEAISQGASAILCEAQGLETFLPKTAYSIPIIPVTNLESFLGKLAKRFYADPSQELDVIGVTGTNGKTTSTYVLAQALTRLRKPCAVMGTLGYGFIPELTDCALTTPDAISLQKYLYELKNKSAKAVAMEVSSHGLMQNRVNSLEIKSALFTNLTQDHLDYHGTMEAYGKAKQKLFQFPSLTRAVINADSPYADKMLRAISRQIPVASYTLQNTMNAIAFKNTLTICVKSLTQNHKGIIAKLDTPWGEGVLRSSLLGEFNLSNLLGVLAELCLQGFTLEESLHALSFAMCPPGRMQRIGGIRTPQIIIDYAHTPDALEKALKAARDHCERRLWCVFGCGGDRDKDKRAKMGHIAAQYADRVVVTSDNPRTEEPFAIIDDIWQGLTTQQRENAVQEIDRKSAIEYAIKHALAIDTILIAGKGHENYQIIGHETIPFSDAKCASEILGEENT
ncbi:UDP-N-acetylmuramoyl-L-alanyl-D-glutamate--2,6-diaminopimelate ligase [Candidatus Berkiella aquae]|nr:UDP-N-acetylmuramoyl-L-alanyl-D-glutamate--2,6-diaminopimelate ligase [Candidatus Berkiella aquae]MCS5710802.1 UDP-N-acetylmuramoyl-L-alanyl-D-glutamate--2,6-diaminopimelate ligase [Candidatus Berkiella aquae]